MPGDELRAELGANPPQKLVAQLDAKALEHLTAAVRAAKSRQHEALVRAERNALSHLPWVVRKALRTVLG